MSPHWRKLPLALYTRVCRLLVMETASNEGTVSMNTTKVRVDLTIEIDLDEYRANYGDMTITDIRNEVRYAVLTAVTSGGVVADGIRDASLNNVR